MRSGLRLAALLKPAALARNPSIGSLIITVVVVECLVFDPV
jgi:hypothetical protein